MKVDVDVMAANSEPNVGTGSCREVTRRSSLRDQRGRRGQPTHNPS
jgi:hypothetical protein